ncbi:Ribosomal L1 domain-containing protein 1 [Rhizopus azygosporus]|uniref:Ribosomal L1 domain-containing protein 1 n=1 Tax=Rhizopus azygosporus TaxID=86630 RepID=A0A367JE07_RHIAZ|nr:Ribosomal L1 domain-containing protein 1 [Rhizopus azygosporus]
MQIDQDKVKKAFKALYKHESGNEQEIVWLMISTFENNNSVKRNPARILLKHGCHVPGVRRCLFVRASQQSYKDMIKEKKIKGIHKVIDLKHLKKQYPTLEAQQKLMDEFDMFLADNYTIHRLRKVFCKEVYKKRREPMPINLKAEDLQKEVLLAAKSTFMNFMTGSCYAVRIATTGQTDTIAYENFMSAYKKIAAATPGGEEAIRSLQIKTANSTSLPIYEASLE